MFCLASKLFKQHTTINAKLEKTKVSSVMDLFHHTCGFFLYAAAATDCYEQQMN